MTKLIGGAELGGTKCILAVANDPTDILYRTIIDTRESQKTLRDIFTFFNDYELDTIGIGTFGPIVLDSKSRDYGLLISESKKGWEGTNISHEFSRNIKAKVVIDTDVNVAAIGEYYHGSGKGFHTIVYVTVGTGIGGGLMVGGQIHTGNFHLEMGHMRIPNRDNFEGVCKFHGDCWEGLASGPSMEERWGVSASELSEFHPAWDKEAELLAHGIVSIIANYSPDRVILGGGVMNQKQLYAKIRFKVTELWNDYTPLGELSDLIVEPELGNDSGIIGAICLAKSDQ